MGKDINISETKIVFFSKSPHINNLNFTFNDETLEVVDSYTNLGAIFATNGKFSLNKDHILQQAKKALFGLNQKLRMLKLPIATCIELFNTYILPILTYACEVWGFINTKEFDTFQLSFLKSLTLLRKSTANCMIYGDTGQFPISIHIKTQMISFWHNRAISCSDKLSTLIYKTLLTMHVKGQIKSPWLTHIKNAR